MNIICCISSIFHGFIIHQSTKEKYLAHINNTGLVILTYFGVLSSVIKHGTSLEIAIQMDRLLMVLALCVYFTKTLSHIEHKYNQRLVLQTATMYLYSKYGHPPPIQTVIHIFTHINASYTYWRILTVEEKRIRTIS
jgi:hypothetical protein